MRVDLALLADAATVDSAGKLNILGIFDSITSTRFPAKHGLISLVLRFSAGLAQAGEHAIRIRLRGPSGEDVLRLDGKVKFGPGPASDGGQLKIPHILNMDGIVFRTPGRYAFDVDLDGEHQVSLPLRVVSSAFAAAAEA
ncbi:MAG: hypothetical protein OXR82_10710 [Gammaproteobacteria bacterium]|nr:hypothetical protein [Gammaproteobacteria bacterium]MDE0258835.1 hypothetical protein [Gammaproteobacteria bacterium]